LSCISCPESQVCARAGLRLCRLVYFRRLRCLCCTKDCGARTRPEARPTRNDSYADRFRDLENERRENRPGMERCALDLDLRFETVPDVIVEGRVFI